MADKILSTLQLTGGTDCKRGLTPDLFVYGGAKIVKSLCVGGDLRVDQIRTTDMNITGNLQVGGCLASELIGFTELATFETVVGNVIIEPSQYIIPTSVQITKMPCSGIITDIDPSGNVTYVPSGNITPPILDIYQYTGLDSCGIQHTVTQFVCSRNVYTPPILNNQCFYVGDNWQSIFSPGVYYSTDLGGTYGPISALTGTSPINWSSFTIVSASTYTTGGVYRCAGSPNLCSIANTLPYPYDDYGFTGPGTLVGQQIVFNHPIGTTYFFDVIVDPMGNFQLKMTMTNIGFPFQPGYVFKLQVQVSDINGNPSNIATLSIAGDIYC